MDTMYKLTKQIDALTYNSRSVLNALIRSCIAAGSSNGYTVRRYGVELTLDRTDIFRLYDFYQAWANGSYGYDPYTADPDEFASIVDRCNAKWKGDGQPVTKAIVTHSKILYLVSTNKNQDGDDYWLGLIRDSSTPKLVTNSAPIPLNLRTPLYDADLSTKSFSQYETYLFPSGYNKLSITGMPGDGEDHVGGGKSWLWDIDESFEVSAPRILLGYHSNPQRRVENYLDTKYSMSFGYDTYALRERSVALGGLDNIACGVDSAVIGGAANLSLGQRSMVAGGYVSTSVGNGSLAFGRLTNSVGPYSLAGNMRSNAGDYVYRFTIEEPVTSGKMVDCEVIKDTTTGVCMTTDSSSSFTSGDGRNTVRITYDSLVSNGLWELTIEKGDDVLIFAQTRKEDNRTYQPTDVEGYAFEPLSFKVTNVSRSNGDYLVQLSDSIPKGESFLSMWQNGGCIVKQGCTVRGINYSGEPLDSVYLNPGDASTALNYNTFTPGFNQTAVGQMNHGDIDAKFMVGVGSSYVGADSFRRNGLSVAQGYGYMQTADRTAVLGVGCASDYRGIDSGFMGHGAWMYHCSSHLGYAGKVMVNDARTEIAHRSMTNATEDSRLVLVRSGSAYLSADYDVTMCLESRAGTVVINSGSYVGTAHAYDVLLPQGPLNPGTGSHGLAIYSEDGMELRNTNEAFTMSFENSGYISAKFKGLHLHGNTWGTLATTDESRSFWVYHNAANAYDNPYNTDGHCVDYPNTIAYSGFFYAQNGWNPGAKPATGHVNLPSKVRGSWEEHQGRGMHIINSAVSYVNSSNQSGYDVSCLILPGLVKSDEKNTPPHPKFINSFIYGNGNGGTMPEETYVAEELAFLSDIKKSEPDSYYDKLNSSTIRKVFYRVLNVSGDSYKWPWFGESEFTEGRVLSGTWSQMANYFGYLKDNPQAMSIMFEEDAATRTPIISAPVDNTESITVRRFGSLVACNLKLTFNGDAVKYSEYLVVGYHSPTTELGIQSSLILNGSGTKGVSVTCVISNTINEEYNIGGTKYSSDMMYQFLIRNPNGLVNCTVPITLMGVIN
jgi:hypothetical protein